MKSRIIRPSNNKVPMSRAEIKAAVEKEFAKQHYNLYQETVQDITVQILANVLSTLELWYGWKKDRLRKFIDTLHSEEDDMLRLKVTTLDNVQKVKERYGIDLYKEFPAHVEKQEDNHG